MATKLWKFLTTDVRELNWGQSADTVKTGAEAAKAVFDFAKAFKEQKSKVDVQTLKPYVEQISSLLDVLNAPLGQIASSVIPFAPIAISILKLIADATKKEPSLEECVALVSQVAYLESFQAILKENQELLTRIGKTEVSEPVAGEIKKLGEVEIDELEARKAIVYFHESKLAEVFNGVLQQRLQQAGLTEAEAKTLTERVARKTNENMMTALVEAGDAVKRLVEWYRVGGKEQLEKYFSIDEYLKKEIKPKPDETIFDETDITFRDLYVLLKVNLLDNKGEAIRDKDPIELEEWVKKMLDDPQKQHHVLFVQGEAGRGKSVFCRMFAERVRRELHPSFTPILIRLRQLRAIEHSLTDTLKNYLENVDFVTTDSGWLTDKNTRFLFLLDGFDELLLEGRACGGLQEFLEQVERFQRDSHHRFLVTGRPLALQGIERLLSQTRSLERVAIAKMDDQIRQTWLDKWAVKVGAQEATDFKQFLDSCPKEINDNLAREPLLLYLLGRMHREQRLNAQMFAQANDEIKAKIRIYDESVKWVLEKQRENENLRLAGLESEDLRRFLTEAALCVVQSGNECAKVAMLEARLKDSNDSVAKLIQKARQETSLQEVKEEKVLNNLLTAFYIKPASGDKGGSVEFTHKSFGEFLFVERLLESFQDWTRKVKRGRREEDDVSQEVMDKQIYDLLGYGDSTWEIVGYLSGLLAESSDIDVVRLFERLQDFYLRWCNGEFIDAPPEKENLPMFKKELLRKQLPERENHLGLRQVDIYAGLNVMILLFELHRYAQQRDDLKDKIAFYPCGQPNTQDSDRRRLLQIIGYGQCLGVDIFNRILGANLRGANLSQAYLRGTNLCGANLRGANLSRAYLRGADLSLADLRGANLSRADLTQANLGVVADLRGANLSGANLSGADLSRANLSRADLSGADLTLLKWDNDTKWANARGLHEAVNTPPELVQQPAFSAAVSLSQGISWVREGKVAEAIQAYNQALSLDPSLDISAWSWNTLCWFGSLHNHADKVLYAGEKAVNQEPDKKVYQDSRGLARALTGDLAGALDDFQAVLDSGIFNYSENVKQRRQRWVDALKAGNNPFTPDELEELRKVER